MKLHQLTLTAFGPFAGREQIDFAKLGDNPLFLIDGPTGAGKSSILHAVCYALYGETTDSERKELGIRCDYAEPETLTEIELEFSIRGQRYRIHRVPTQMRPAKRGGGETEQKATAHLLRIAEDGSEETLVPKKKTDADARIKEILGLTADQFRQVMVLPQGKFRELLLAKSDDRQAILSTLFQTEIYQRIEQRLKDRAGDIERQHKKFEDSKTEALLELHLEDVDALIEAIATAVEAVEAKNQAKSDAYAIKSVEEQKLKSAETLKKSFEQQTLKQQELAERQSRKPAVDSARDKLRRAEKAAAIAPEWKALRVLDQQIQKRQEERERAAVTAQQASTEAASAAEHLKATEESYKQRDELKTTETRLTGYQKVLAGYESLRDEVRKANAAHTAAAARMSELEQGIARFDESLKERNAEIEMLTGQVGQKAELTEQLLSAKRRWELAIKLDGALAEQARREQAVTEAQAALGQANSAHQQASTQADRLEMIWFTNQAAVLAKKLELDHPCPVCGSLEHPNPAQFADDSAPVDQDAVEQARAIASARLTERHTAETRVSERQSAVQSQQQLIAELRQELEVDLFFSAEALKDEYARLDQQLNQISACEHRLESLKAIQKSEESKRELLQAEQTELNRTLPKLSGDKAAAESRLISAENELPENYRSLDALSTAIRDTQLAIEKLEQAYQAAQKRHSEASNRLTAANSALDSLTRQLDELQGNRAEQLTAWQNALSESEFESQSDFEASLMDEASAETLRARIVQYDETVKSLQAQLALMAEQLKDQQPPELEALQERYQQAESAYQQAEHSWAEAQQQKALFERTLEKIRSLEEQQQAVKQQYEVVGKMAKAASGRGEVRVSLERFVLGNLLDSVLSVASQRLYTMSKGQYRLVRQNETEQKRNVTAGLDLAIDDAYSGKTRPVATLSGGESFMASLSLALALSEVVQQRSGGIQLDTLFIDEGFGSLDQESLQLAIDMLVELQATGRTIGIISHVSELKDQMPLRIDVKCGRDGSYVSMSQA
ncbi:AAA family ATPase [Marinobacterium mangrovicola]|uniref:Exonuclease SbcC n=1 Tax=Marinobacterium mangrovicola TaxID=1476959 RepID=A0A4R1GLM4_9GAMM|nr:SMC family ATPase [Marinobacterium mangrovicola]TCK09158.1 exonuclease SbcC [Marinobacterium mangrovicola]